jgi:hypothetical protein
VRRLRQAASSRRRQFVGGPCLSDVADIDLIGLAEIPDAHDGADASIGKPNQIEKRERREMHGDVLSTSMAVNGVSLRVADRTKATASPAIG